SEVGVRCRAEQAARQIEGRLGGQFFAFVDARVRAGLRRFRSFGDKRNIWQGRTPKLPLKFGGATAYRDPNRSFEIRPGDVYASEPGCGRRNGISEIIDWLAGDECHELDDAKFGAELGGRLRAMGLPLDPPRTDLRTFHPEIRSHTGRGDWSVGHLNFETT